MQIPASDEPQSASMLRGAEMRGCVDPAFVQFHNPTESRCPRWAVSHAFNEHYCLPDEPLECCSFHHPNDTYLQENAEQAQLMMAGILPSARSQLWTDRTFAPLHTAEQKALARKSIQRWRMQAIGLKFVQYSMMPPSTILPDHLVASLVSKLHCVTSKDRMLTVLQGWYSGWAMVFMDELFEFCHNLIVQLDGAAAQDRSQGPSLALTRQIAHLEPDSLATESFGRPAPSNKQETTPQAVGPPLPKGASAPAHNPPWSYDPS